MSSRGSTSRSAQAVSASRGSLRRNGPLADRHRQQGRGRGKDGRLLLQRQRHSPHCRRRRTVAASGAAQQWGVVRASGEHRVEAGEGADGGRARRGRAAAAPSAPQRPLPPPPHSSRVWSCTAVGSCKSLGRALDERATCARAARPAAVASANAVALNDTAQRGVLDRVALVALVVMVAGRARDV